MVKHLYIIKIEFYFVCFFDLESINIELLVIEVIKLGEFIKLLQVKPNINTSWPNVKIFVFCVQINKLIKNISGMFYGVLYKSTFLHLCKFI